MVRAKSKRRGPGILLAPAVLLLLTGVAYWNSFDAPLVFDDLLTIQSHAGVQFGDNLRPSIGTTRPLLYLTFAINYALHGQKVWGYHLVNFALHFLNGILVFLIAQHIFRRSASSETEARTYALLAAGFFLVHPLQTESVTYVSSRSELLSTAFYGLAVLSFVKRDERKIGFLWSLIVAALFLVGLLAKETVISLPAVLQARDNYLHAIRLDPLFAQARHNLALVYMQANNFPKAIDSFEDVLRLDPNSLSAHLNLAKISIQLGNRNAAREHLSKVLSIAPEQQEAAALLRELGS